VAVTALLGVDEALAHVLARAVPLAVEQVPLTDAAGRVLAEPAVANVDLPPFPSSAMDGFALRADDTPGSLPVVARIAAGRPATRALEPGEAMGIATGGVVPAGADAVVPLEDVAETENAVTIPTPVVKGANVRSRGGDVTAGEVAVAAGTTLTPARIAALAACGVSTVRCGARPRVVVLATGTELRPPGVPLAEGEIYESNGVMLGAALVAAGAVVERVGPVADDEDAHRAAIEHGLGAHVLVTSGGVSVGPHDLVRRIERALGVDEIFWGVAMRPGKPLSFGVRGSTLVFGLPGNPVSSLVGCLLFACPAVRALQGASDPGPRYLSGVLSTAVTRNAARDDFVRARSAWTDGGVALSPIGGQESHMIVRSAAADALVHVPRGTGTLAAGSPVRFLPL
jgi:molybdopterin molybdotransferase